MTGSAGHPVHTGRRKNHERRGLLDHPPEPVVRPAKGRTGWRV